MKTTLLLLFCLAAIGLNAQIVNIPDPNFKAALLNHNPVIDTNGDGEIQISEAEAVTGMIIVSNQNISDLTGIGAFTNIMILYCNNNQLTHLNISQNVQLEELHCNDNQLTELNVSQNIALETIACGNNQLIQLNVSPNLALKALYIYYNHLTELNVSDNIDLIFLHCNNNQLTNLDLRNGSYELEVFADNNPNLACIFVDSSTYSDSALGWHKDDRATYVETQQECDALAIIEYLKLERINIYPNPVKNELFVDLESWIQNSELIIANISGKIIHKFPIQGKHFQFDLSQFSKGIYFLQIYRNKIKLLTKKFVKL